MFNCIQYNYCVCAYGVAGYVSGSVAVCIFLMVLGSDIDPHDPQHMFATLESQFVAPRCAWHLYHLLDCE